MDYEESITQNKTLSNIISKNYQKMYSVELPKEFSGELVRFSKRLFSVLTGHMDIFTHNYSSVPFEFLDAIYPTLKMMNDIGMMVGEFETVNPVSDVYIQTFNIITHGLANSVKQINIITSQASCVYKNIIGQPKTLFGKKEFTGEFARLPEQIAPDNWGIRVELFILALLNLDKTSYDNVQKLLDRIKALLAS